MERVKNSGKKCIVWSSINYILCQILITDQIKINRACSMHEGKLAHTVF